MNGKIASKKAQKIRVLKVDFQRGFMNGAFGGSKMHF